MTPTIVFFDLDGVVRRFESAGGLGDVTRIGFSSDLFLPALRGEIADARWRDDVRRRVAPHLSSVARVWARSRGRVDEDVLAIVREVRHCARVGLLTNATSRLHEDLDALELSGEFDAVISSADWGVLKPDRRIFEIACESQGVDASAVVFVDDVVENVAAARSLGMGAIHFVSGESLASRLRERGVL